MEERTTIQISEKLRKELRILSSKRNVSYQELLQDMIKVFKELDKERTVISIPKRLAKKIEDNIKNTDMSSISEYVTFILRSILSEDLKINESEKERKIIINKLKSLGYL